MKATIITSMMAAAVLLLSACSENETPATPAVRSNTPVQLAAAGTVLTRVTANDSWEEGDQIGLAMMNADGSSTFPTPASYTYEVQPLTSTDIAFAPATGSETAYFPAYPAKVKFAAWHPVTADVKAASGALTCTTVPSPDILIAATAADYDEVNKTVQLRFRHATAKITVTVKIRQDLEDQVNFTNAKLEITGTAKSGKWNLSDGNAVIDSETTTLSATVPQARVVTLLAYPTTPASDLVFTLTDGNGKTFTARPAEPVTLKTGSNNTFTLTLNPEVKVNFTGIIEEWGEEEQGGITGNEDIK